MLAAAIRASDDESFEYKDYLLGFGLAPITQIPRASEPLLAPLEVLMLVNHQVELL